MSAGACEYGGALKVMFCAQKIVAVSSAHGIRFHYSLGLKASVNGNHQSDTEAVQSTPITMVLAYMS